MAGPRALTRAFYESFNTGDVEALADVVALDYGEVHDGVRHHLGLEGARAHVLGVRSPLRLHVGNVQDIMVISMVLFL